LVALLRLFFQEGDIIRSLLIFLFSLVAIVMTVWMDGYYKRYFGTVKKQTSKRSLLPNLFAGAVILAIILDTFLKLPISLAAFMAALFMAYMWRLSRGLLPHYPVLALLFGFTTVIPFFLPTEARLDALQLVFSIICIFAGILDHRMLQSALHAPQDADDDHTF
jgi:hypothetical protein